MQRTDSALRLNVHMHALVLDGVYVHKDGDSTAPLEFRELDAPTHADVAEIASRTATRIESILKTHGRSLDPELGEQELPELCFDEPGQIHIAQDRLERQENGRLELIFKKVWRDGTRALLLDPHDLIARLVAAVPPPRSHMLRYFGVLSSHSSRRALVVPKPPVDASADKPPPARGDQLELLGEQDDVPTVRKRWAWLLAHVFAADVDTCPRCSGPMRWAEVATSRAAITRLIAEHEDGLGSRAPPAPRVPIGVPEQLGMGCGER